MKSSVIVVIALAFAMTAFMFAGSGFDAMVDANPSDPSPVEDAVNDTAGTGPASDGEVSSRGSGGGSLLEFVPSAPSFAIEVLTIGLVLGEEMRRIGFPVWVTTPVGWITQIVLSIGIVQFLLNRVFL